jgi:Fe-S cluster biogenesis protein NfuA
MQKEDVQKAINDIRPALQSDGGDIELINVSDDGIVQVKLKGACHGCPRAHITLKQVIEKHIKNKVPSIVSVEAV